MSSCVWIMGASAVGRKTFISKIACGSKIQSLIWDLDNMIIYEKSLERRYGRNLTVKDILKKVKKGYNTLIKVQWTEIRKDIPVKLFHVIENKLPFEVIHKIICLVADLEILSKRRKLYRKWMSFDIRDCLQEQISMINYALMYESRGFDLVFIDSTKEYKIITKSEIYKFCNYDFYRED